jgi:hypothetical protein
MAVAHVGSDTLTGVRTPLCWTPLLATLATGLPKRRARHSGGGILYAVTSPPSRQITSWEVAEQNAGDWMRHWGYRNVRLTPSGADQGIDVRATGAIAQVKFEARQVGRPQLQHLVGARGRDYNIELLFFTGAGYSAHAVKYASEMGIALFTYALDGRVYPENRAATLVVERGRHSNADDGRVGFPPRSPSGSKALAMILAGLILTASMVMGIFKAENWAAGPGAIFTGFATLFIGLLLVRAGWRRSR